MYIYIHIYIYNVYMYICIYVYKTGVAEEGEGWLSTKAPTWPQQRTFYLVIN